MDAIDSMHHHYGNRATLQFAERLQQQRQNMDIHGIADRGLSSAAEAYPFKGQIKASFGKYYNEAVEKPVFQSCYQYLDSFLYAHMIL